MLADNAVGDHIGEHRQRGRAVVGRVTTALACLLVLFVLVAPTGSSRLTPAAFVHLPVEAILGVALVLIVPAKARRVTAVLVGTAVGLFAIIEITDVGFLAVLDRRFDPVFDWSFLAAAVGFVRQSIGSVGAVASVVAAGVLAAGVLILVALSVLRLSRVVARRRTAAARGVTVLAVIWLACAVTGVQVVPGMPIAVHPYYDRVLQVRASLHDREAFAAQAATDAFRDTQGADLLTGLRDKDVIVAFVESYGRVAVDDPELAPQVGAVLEAGNRRLRAAGFGARSAFLTSPTVGGGSWLAHATLLSGLWVDNQQRYRRLMTSDRVTLSSAFRRARWRTVAVMPGLTQAWPEGRFFGYDRIYAPEDLGYHGPKFSFATMPDEYTLSAFERLERGAQDRVPVMAVIPLISSHAPWAPVPRFLGWDDLGDGSVFDAMSGAGDPAGIVWRRDANRVRRDYGRAIEYSLTTLISYVETYGDDDLVLVFLGDHQPAPVITGTGGSRDVPVTIVARDRAVLDRIVGWGWQEGLRPGPRAPVWPMDAFRDRFLDAFAPQPPPAASPARQPR